MHYMIKQTEPKYKLLGWMKIGPYQHLHEWCLEVGPLRIVDPESLGL